MQTKFRELWVEKYRPKTIQDYIFENEGHEVAFKSFIRDNSIPHLLLTGVAGSGKAQPLDSKILTPSGWTTMGNLKIGDRVSTPDGKNAEVLGIFDQGIIDAYEIEFHDGSKTVCNSEHLWECYYPRTRGRKAERHISTLSDIILLREKNKNINISIPLIDGYTPTEVITPSIDSYTLGVILGDGGTTQGTISITSKDEEILNRIQINIGSEFSLNNKLSNGNPTLTYSIVDTLVQNLGSRRGNTSNRLTSILRDLNLFGLNSHEKFIPSECFNYSMKDRWELVRGLMDTDGTIKNNKNSTSSSVSYTTVSEKLAMDMRNILFSLGCTCTVSTRKPFYTYNGTRKIGSLAYTLHINHPDGGSQFFNLPRKKKMGSDKFNENSINEIKLRRRIKNITKQETQQHMRCIFIDSPEHLYITDDYIVTHNSTIAQILINELGIEEGDILSLNASDENSVDVMRDKINSFVMTHAFGELGIKLVLLEEADYITLNGQAVLRRLMEDYVDEARFILTGNLENRIMPAIKSRCQHFKFHAADKDDIAEYVAKILMQEEIEFDIDQLDMYVASAYPDIRKIVNNIQQSIDDTTLMDLRKGASGTDDYRVNLLSLIANDSWTKARTLVCSNANNDEIEGIYRFLYENLDKSKKFSKEAAWESGQLLIAEYLYMHSIVADPEINLAALFIELKGV